MPIMENKKVATETRKVVFMEMKTGDVLLVKNVKSVYEGIVTSKRHLIIDVIRENFSYIYQIPFCDLKWYSVKTEEFHNLEGGEK